MALVHNSCGNCTVDQFQVFSLLSSGSPLKKGLLPYSCLPYAQEEQRFSLPLQMAENAGQLNISSFAQFDSSESICIGIWDPHSLHLEITLQFGIEPSVSIIMSFFFWGPTNFDFHRSALNLHRWWDRMCYYAPKRLPYRVENSRKVIFFPFVKITDDYSKEVQWFLRKWSFDYILGSIFDPYLQLLSVLNHNLEQNHQLYCSNSNYRILGVLYMQHMCSNLLGKLLTYNHFSVL